MLLAALLASASLQLTPLPPGQAELRLCFDQPTPAIRYELLVIAQGPAGRSQSRQRGVADKACPVRNSLHMPASTRVEARLRWWVDEVEQQALSTELPP
ncbi:hypothetical protein NG726_08340 [Pseudomonas sp. MOB-449]|nr:hypothetical protein [Pseudomonas sp. MOB-449]